MGVRRLLIVLGICLCPAAALAASPADTDAYIARAMQTFGAMGMTKEIPLQLMQAKLRTMRIYDGPTEVHKWVVARNMLGTRR